MKKLFLFFMCLAFGLSMLHAESDETPIPTNDKWEKKNDRSISSPQLYQSESSVYVYYEKQLDNVTIGITDMQGNTWHYEVTTIPACTYYAVSIDSLPSGEYYFCVYQGSNYIIGFFNK